MLWIRQSGAIRQPPSEAVWSTKYTTPSLCYRQSGLTYYVPLVQSGGSVTIGAYKYSYSAANYPRLAVRYNGATYYAVNKKEAVSTYDIPPGTYTAAAFDALIATYIAKNGSRIAANAFTARVGTQTVSIAAGEPVSYKEMSTSPQGFARYVHFGASGGTLNIADSNSVSGFASGKNYVSYVCTGSGFQFVQVFGSYAGVSITIGTGINFR